MSKRSGLSRETAKKEGRKDINSSDESENDEIVTVINVDADVYESAIELNSEDEREKRNAISNLLNSENNEANNNQVSLLKRKLTPSPVLIQQLEEELQETVAHKADVEKTIVETQGKRAKLRSPSMISQIDDEIADYRKHHDNVSGRIMALKMEIQNKKMLLSGEIEIANKEVADKNEPWRKAQRKKARVARTMENETPLTTKNTYGVLKVEPVQEEEGESSKKSKQNEKSRAAYKIRTLKQRQEEAKAGAVKEKQQFGDRKIPFVFTKVDTKVITEELIKKNIKPDIRVPNGTTKILYNAENRDTVVDIIQKNNAEGFTYKVREEVKLMPHVIRGISN